MKYNPPPVTPASEQEIAEMLEQLPGWRRRGENFVRELEFRDVTEAFRFAEQLAEGAVDYHRRPELCITHTNRLRVLIHNEHRAGPTLAELRLAAKVHDLIERQLGDSRPG